MSKERLTKRIDLGNGKYSVDFANDIVGEFLNDHKKGVKALFHKLAEYEDLEEQGLLLRLPAKTKYNVFRGESIAMSYKFDLIITSEDIYNKLSPEDKKHFSNIKILKAVSQGENIIIECLASHENVNECAFIQRAIGEEPLHIL